MSTEYRIAGELDPGVEARVVSTSRQLAATGGLYTTFPRLVIDMETLYTYEVQLSRHDGTILIYPAQRAVPAVNHEAL